MIVFEDLVFESEQEGSDCSTSRAVAKFANGFGVSVICGGGSLTSAEKPYELAVIEYQSDSTYRILYPLIFDYDVIPYLTAEEVTTYMKMIQSLPGDSKHLVSRERQ
jgi:hypothetical protein